MNAILSPSGILAIWVQRMSKYEQELRCIQQQYLSILKTFPSDIDIEDYYYRTVSFIDQCEAFWMSKRLELSEILTDLSENEQCFLLSGAVYLDIGGNGHYAFGAIGTRNIVNDPVLRMRSFFDGSITASVSYKLKKYFADAVSDTIIILEKYSDCFIVISMDSLLFPNHAENKKLGEKVYWDVLSNALNRNIQSLESFHSEFSTIRELECALGDTAKRFVFSDLSDFELPLEERVEKWFKTNSSMMNMNISGEIDQFFIASIAQIQQALDILLKCLTFNLYHFIRFEVSFQYFIIIAGAFSDDTFIKAMAEYAVICYLFANQIVPEDINKFDFRAFRRVCKEKRLGNVLRDAVFSDGASFLSLNVRNAISIMRSIYADEIQVAL